MYRTAETFLHVVYEALYAPYGTGYNYEGVNWEILYKMAEGSKLAVLTYETAKRLSKDYIISEDVLEKWHQEYIAGTEKALECKNAFAEFASKAKEEGIKYTVFKGFVLADLFPNPLYRTSNDTDILIKKEDTAKIAKFLKKLDYQKDKHDSTGQVPVYYRENPAHRLELHYSLWEEFKGPKIDMLEGFGITKDTSFLQMNAWDVELTTLGYEEHLIYQMFHIIKHILVEGMSFSGLVDITLYINKYGKNIDFTSFWRKMEALGYATFCETFFQCCIHYLKMDGSIMKRRPLPSIDMKGYLLVEMIHKIMMPFHVEDEVKMYMLTRPYVDGMDAYDNPERHLHEPEYKNVLKRAEEKIKTIHMWGLTCQETSTGEIEEKEIIFTKDLKEAKKNAPYFYQIYGLTVASEIEMSELISGESSGIAKEDADVYVHYCEEQGMLQNPQLQMIQSNRVWFESTHARFLVQNGNEIVADKKEDKIPDEKIKPYIISHGLAFILYMKNIVTLHGSTVGNEAGAITIIGNSGAGKSTISTGLRKQGYKLIADDVSAIKLEHGVPYVQIAVPQQKFCRDTALKEGYKLEEIECINEIRDKYRVKLTDDEMCSAPVKLKGIFEIILDTKDNSFRVEKVEGLDLLKLMSANMFSQYLFSNSSGLSADMFQTTLQIAKQIPVYRIYRPTDQDTVEQILNEISTLLK